MTITCDGCGATNLTTAIKNEGGWLCRNCAREKSDAGALETKDGWPRLMARIKVPPTRAFDEVAKEIPDISVEIEGIRLADTPDGKPERKTTVNEFDKPDWGRRKK